MPAHIGHWSTSLLYFAPVVVLVGFLEGSDRYGALLGVSPKFHLFH